MNSNIYNSICLASYNGERFIEKQLLSILNQIEEDDEVIIVDDRSTDSTVSIIKHIQDPRIKLVINETNVGVNKSFEKCISLASGKYIFLSDQDDIWPEGRYQIMIKVLRERSVLCVSGNTKTIDEHDNFIDYHVGSLKSSDEKKYRKNIMRIFTGHAYYYGCAMAFDNKIKDIILPFPENLESHDLWIAMAANRMHSNVHLEDTVLFRRIHGKNVSVVSRSLFSKFRSRLIFLSMLNLLDKRIKENSLG